MAKKVMPQEIEVWYLLPALRREIAKIIIKKHKLNQKKTAKILGITEAAISQYISSKRGKKIVFSKKESMEIEKAANKIVEDPENAIDYLYQLSIFFRGSDVVCRIHKKHDLTLPKSCTICMK